ncbi:MAG: hypothetical protein F2825_10250 [Actinobacteria bacterium]|uniref:Unannotated protein n=1 Tax=freshwater metagenome TaxID=449393 RepID=A0A6J7ILF1_9ZZZZ|nr:hypothetical protein [Actinomycetota bacterium]
MSTGSRAAYAAHLRVYEPLAAFEGDERRQWQDLLAAGALPDREQALAREHAAALRALCGLAPPVLPELEETALVTDLDGVTLISPLRTRVRSAEALLDFTEHLHDDLVEAYAPGAALVTAETELDAWRTSHPERRLHALTSPWQVPVRWFVLVEPEERVLHPGGPPGALGMRTGRAMVYRTPMSRARRRAARALAVLRRSVEDGAVVDSVESMARWLEDFHPRSLVELDYGGLVHLADDERLAADDSAADVAEARAALAEQDPERAADAYGRVQARMKALQAVEGAN